jgi:O-acetyl-ADP-ribose deacetylase (regulator of RNase III)
MGAGVAREIKDLYPSMYQDYRINCLSGMLYPGMVLFADYTKPPIFNLISQDNTGANASLNAIERSMRRMYEIADANGITTIAINRIGAGIGGLKWADVKAVIESIEWTGTLYVYEVYINGQ